MSVDPYQHCPHLRGLAALTAAQLTERLAAHFASAGGLATDAERIAAIAALPQEAVVGIVLGELRSHISEMIVAESAYRASAAAEAARAATQAQVEASFG